MCDCESHIPATNPASGNCCPKVYETEPVTKTTILMTDVCLQLLPCSYLQACTLYALSNING